MIVTVNRDLYAELIGIEERGKRNKSSLVAEILGWTGMQTRRSRQ